jgi:UDP-glucose 4-epimerase
MRLAGSKILVTGGAGFVGSHVVDQLVRAGARVTVLDDLSSGHEDNLAGVRDDVELVHGSILDQELLHGAARGADAICHQAAQLEIIRCIEEPLEDLRSNAEGTLNILEAARALGIGRVVYASSACVYGQARHTPQSEDHPKQPNWPYGVSKLAAEHYARLYGEYYGIETAGLRYSIVYGPREWYGRVMTAFLRRGLDGDPPVVWGGQQIRDFVYVEDIAAANLACLEADALPALAYNLSTGRGTTIRELADAVAAMLGLGEPIYEDVAEGEVSELVDGRVRLPAELATMVLDPRRAAADLGWTAQTDLQTGMAREVEWLREHRDRWTVMHY